MAFTEKPPMLSGPPQQQISALRDYLFRMAKSLEDSTARAAEENRVVYDRNGHMTQTATAEDKAALEAVRKSAQELQALIIKTANDLTDDINNGDAGVIAYADQKTEEYNLMYVARSEYGEFTETIDSRIDTTARGVVESYNYGARIQSAQDNIKDLQDYYKSINGEIRRGIVLDPDTGEYVTGIAIAQALQFKAGISPAAESYLPDDGYTYYEMNEGQTFGLYTSVGWQFWIDGYKKGWYSSLDRMLHVANVLIEQVLQVGSKWQMKSSADGEELEFYYAG